MLGSQQGSALQKQQGSALQKQQGSALQKQQGSALRQGLFVVAPVVMMMIHPAKWAVMMAMMAMMALATIAMETAAQKRSLVDADVPVVLVVVAVVVL